LSIEYSRNHGAFDSRYPSIAFSPTDAMPLTRWTKILMMAESAVSAVTVLLVAARSVNIVK
jgi:hypothetical protein